jgi:hypothetical protein
MSFALKKEKRKREKERRMSGGEFLPFCKKGNGGV